MLVQVLIIGIFFVVTAAIGIACRRHSGSVGGFVLGGRKLGPWITAFAYGTSYFSSVVFIGYAGQFGWSFGVAATWIGIGNALIGSLLAWSVLGRRTRVMTKHLESATMPDFFSKRYLSHSLRVTSSVIIFIFLVPYSASVYKGLSGLFSMTFGIDFLWCIIGIAVLTCIYVVAGGYMATAINDLVQGIIMIGGIILVIVRILDGQGGFISAIEKLSAIENPATPELQGAFASFFGPAPIDLVWVLILTSLGTWGLPQMVHKFYTINSEKSIKAGTIISTAFALIIAGGSYFMGGFGRLYYTPGEGGVVFDDIVPTMLAGSLPDLLIGVVLVLVLSASMSTLSSLVITSSSTFTLDFLGQLPFLNMKKETKLVVIKVMCVLFILLSVLIAVNPSNLITTLMSISWGALAGAFLGPFLYGLFWRKVSKVAVWASFACGIGITASNLFLQFASPIAAGGMAILTSLIIVPIVSLITPKLPTEHLDKTFACYQEKVTVAHMVALTEDETTKDN